MEGTGQAEDLCLDITYLQTAMFLTPRDSLEPSRSRRFIISVTDGKIEKEIRLVHLEGKSLRWGETPDHFIVGSSSQLTLRVLEEDGLLDGKLLATFVLPHQMLRSCQQEFLLSVTQKAPSHMLSVTSLIRRIPVPTKKPLLSLPYAGEINELLPGPQSIFADMLVVGVADTSSNCNGKACDPTEVVVISAKTFLDKWRLIINQVGFIVHAVDSISEIHCHAKLAWSVFLVTPKTILEEIQLDKDIIVFLDAIVDALHLAPSNETLNATKLRSQCEQSEKRKEAVKRMMNLITECGYFIQSYIKDSSFRQRVVACKRSVIANFQEQLSHLHNAFLEGNSMNTDTNMVRILGQMECMNGLLEDLHLDTKFPFVQGARFNPEKGCLPATRVKFLDAITNWVNDVDPSSSKALVLFGQAGTGKSSIAHEIAHRFHRTGRLTTSYCFVRGKPSSREPYRFFTTLAHNLCARYPAFRASLCSIIKNNPDVLAAEDYTTLLNSLILEPLKDLQFVSPVIVVIDALDESEDASLHTGGKKIPFHTFLGQHLFQFPPNFCILITSRPETDILMALAQSSFVHHMYMNDPKLAGEIDNDILLYMQKNLHKAKVDDASLRELVKKAEHLFQWASVACHYITDPPRGLNSQHCIQRLLHPTDSKKAARPLDAVYTTVLEKFDMDDEDVRNNFRSVMGQILGAFEPLSIDALDMLCGLSVFGGVDSKTSVCDIVKEMGSLLSNVSPSSSSLVAPIHTSFRDFLVDSNRSGKFYVDLDIAHGQLAYATLRTMQTMLHFNICEIETSHCLNNEVPDLDNRIKAFIPSALSYACRFWADHLGHVSDFDVELFSCLRDLMEVKFLFWLEVLSIRGEMPIATTALLSLETWLSRMKLGDNVQDDRINSLNSLVTDAIAFVRYFGYPMARSVPHIYLSALPFAPSSSKIANLYSPRFSFTLNVKHGRLMQWPALIMAISMPQKPQVVCVAWSRNDEYIAAGLADGNVFVWIASTGTKICGPINAGRQGRRNTVFVSSIAFSHDGLCLASGLSDGRIRIWQLMTGQEAVGIVTVNPIAALSFSKDGKQLVFGSGDHMIRIWDLDKGEVMAGPFSGHQNPVWAVSFLSDQDHVVSWSGFCTVRVWNVKTGECVVDLKSFKETDIPLPVGTIDTTVHYADSLGVYHDQRRVKSGFTPCSWTKAMECKEENFRQKGKFSYYWTQAAAFSGNGKFVATCDPNHVHIWHANGESAGKLAGGPFCNDKVICLGFSADGQRMVTGSRDGIMRVWNVGIVGEGLGVSAKQEVPYSVAFGPDGKQIVIGRQDGTIQLLDVLTGEEVVKIRERDEKRVCQPEVAVSRNGDLISSTTWEKQILIHTRTGQPLATGLLRSSNKNICCVAFSPHSNGLVAFGTNDGTVFVVDASTGMQMAEPKQICTEGVSSLALYSSPINATTTIQTRNLVAVGSKGTAFIWDTHSGHITGLTTHHRDWVRALVFSADGRRVTSAAEDYTLCIWDFMTGNIVMRTVLNGMYSQPSSVFRQAIALTQDGRKVAFTGKQHVILVYDVLYEDADVRRPLVLAGHQNFVNHMAFSNDGRFLATTSDDHTIRVWDIQAAVDHKQAVVDSDPGISNFNEAVIDDDGWAIGWASDDGLPLRLMWIPEMHRESLHRPASVCVVGCDPRKETRLDLKDFFHGRDWVKCKA